MIQGRRIGLFLIPLIAVFGSCSRTEPKISYGTLRLVYYQSRYTPLQTSPLPEPEDEALASDDLASPQATETPSSNIVTSADTIETPSAENETSSDKNVSPPSEDQTPSSDDVTLASTDSSPPFKDSFSPPQNDAPLTEGFSFFVLPEDSDGSEDLSDLYLYNDREGLVWHLSSADWVSYTQDGKLWVGSHALFMGDGETLPRGQFRAVMVDKGGEQSERIFSFDAPQESRHPFPSFTLLSGNYYIAESSYPDNYLLCYDSSGKLLITLPMQKMEGMLAELAVPAEARGFALWADDSEAFCAALTDVVPLK